MRIVAFNQICDFYEKHNQAKVPLLVIYQTLKEGKYSNNKQILQSFPRSSLIKGTKSQIVFRIKGNDFSMIIQFDYSKQIGRIKFIGRHPEYDRL